MRRICELMLNSTRSVHLFITCDPDLIRLSMRSEFNFNLLRVNLGLLFDAKPLCNARANGLASAFGNTALSAMNVELSAELPKISVMWQRDVRFPSGRKDSGQFAALPDYHAEDCLVVVHGRRAV